MICDYHGLTVVFWVDKELMGALLMQLLPSVRVNTEQFNIIQVTFFHVRHNQ